MMILAVDPGSTSTKIGVCDGEKVIFERSIPFAEKERAACGPVLAQLDARCSAVEAALSDAGFRGCRFDAAAGRGGLLAPVPSGTYLVNRAMTDYLKGAPRGEHASNLGPFIALRFAGLSEAPAYIVDPVSVDELSDVARISGAPEIERGSLVHALNQKAMGRKAAAMLGKRYEDCRFVIAHLGTGVTLGAHENGRITDVTGAKADGPFSAERAGGLPADALIELCFSGLYSRDELRKKLLSGWGFVSYLGTRDLREIVLMAETDARASLIFDAFVYQTAKGIGELAAALDGNIDAVVLTGGMAFSSELTRRISAKVGFLGRVITLPGENELEALAAGAARVLRGEERARIYPTGEYV